MIRGRKGEYKKELEQLRKDGYTRVKIDGEMKDLSEDIVLDKNDARAVYWSLSEGSGTIIYPP